MPQHANLRTAGDHGSYCSLDKYKLGLFSWILHFCLHYACADIARACQLFVSVADAEDLLDYFSSTRRPFTTRMGPNARVMSSFNGEVVKVFQ